MSLFTKLITPPGDVALLVKTLQGMRNAEELARNAPATVVLGQVVALLTHMQAGAKPAARKVAKRLKGDGVQGEAGEHSFEAVIGKVGGKPVISRIMVWKGAAKPDNLVADFSDGLMLKGEADPLTALLAEFSKKYPQLSAPMKKQGEEEDEEMPEEETAEGETPSDGDTIHAVIFALAEMLAAAGDPLASQVLAAYDAGEEEETPEEEELEGQEDEAAEGEVEEEEEPMAASARPTMRKALVSGGYAAAKYLVDATGAIQKAQMQISGEEMPPEINQDLETARTAIQSARTAILAQVDARKGARPTMRKGDKKMPSRNILRGTIRQTIAKAARAPMRKAKKAPSAKIYEAISMLLDATEDYDVQEVGGEPLEIARDLAMKSPNSLDSLFALMDATEDYDIQEIGGEPLESARARAAKAPGFAKGDVRAARAPMRKQEEEENAATRVTFYRFPKKDGGDVIAMLWDVADVNPGRVMSYQHVGQHGEASGNLHVNLKRVDPASDEEAADLKAELEGIGYTLTVVQRRPSDAPNPEWGKAARAPMRKATGRLLNESEIRIVRRVLQDNGLGVERVKPRSTPQGNAIDVRGVPDDPKAVANAVIEALGGDAAATFYPPGLGNKGGSTLLVAILTPEGDDADMMLAARATARKAAPGQRRPVKKDATYYAEGEYEAEQANAKKIKRGSLTITDSRHGTMIYGTNLNGDEVFLAQAGDGGEDDYMAEEGYDPNSEADELAEAYGFELVDEKAARATARKAAPAKLRKQDDEEDDAEEEDPLEGDNRDDSEVAEELRGEQADEEMGSAQYTGWHGLYRGGENERAFILHEDSDGNFDWDAYDSNEEAEAAWKELEDELDADFVSYMDEKETRSVMEDGLRGGRGYATVEWLVQHYIDMTEGYTGGPKTDEKLRQIAAEIVAERGGEGEGGEELEASARIGTLRKLAATEPSPAVRAAYEAEIASIEDGIAVQKGGGPDVRVRKFGGFAVGDQVMHKSYGLGRVMALEVGQAGKQVSVVFSDPEKGNVLGPLNIDPRKLKAAK